MSFHLSTRSLSNLQGVEQPLVDVVSLAIVRTKIDFAVIEGIRTLERQQILVDKGASHTLASKHITGHAVDLMAYVGGRGCWELPVYYEIAEAMRTAATELGVAVRWGAAWIVPDIRAWSLSMEEAVDLYIEQRRAQGRKPFIDAPHFELMYI